jgi:arabinose-5-phosphate isomerase
MVALSNSGESAELLSIVPLVKRRGAGLIAMTGNPRSTLAREADVHLDAGVSEEACPLGLAPTASTTAALALGDALAVALLELRGFSAEDFARSHPGGTLGRLLTHVTTSRRGGPSAVAGDALLASVPRSRKVSGMTAILDGDGGSGIFTGSDAPRRRRERTRAGEAVMTRTAYHPARNAWPEAVKVMETIASVRFWWWTRTA